MATRARGDRLTGEETAHPAHGLVEPVESLAEPRSEVDAVGPVLVLEPGAADAQPGATAADMVHGDGGLGREAGVAERVGADHAMSPRSIRLVWAAHAARSVQPSKMGCSGSPTMAWEVVPGPQAVEPDVVGESRRLAQLDPGSLLGPEQGADADGMVSALAGRLGHARSIACLSVARKPVRVRATSIPSWSRTTARRPGPGAWSGRAPKLMQRAARPWRSVAP